MADEDPGITREMYDDLVKRLKAVEFTARRADRVIFKLSHFLFDTDRLNQVINDLRLLLMDPDEAEGMVNQELAFLAEVSDPDSDNRDAEKVAHYLNLACDIEYIKTGKTDIRKHFDRWHSMKKPHENDSKRNKKSLRKE